MQFDIHLTGDARTDIYNIHVALTNLATDISASESEAAGRIDGIDRSVSNLATGIRALWSKTGDIEKNINTNIGGEISNIKNQIEIIQQQIKTLLGAG